jgi:hypothetical protein
MGQLIEYRYVAEVDGYVAAAPFATLAAAVACLRSFGTLPTLIEVRCYWSGEIVWCSTPEVFVCADSVA